MSIHQRIKERRLALGLNSHKALADLVGVSWQTVQLWEKEGGTAPKRNRVEKVAEVLKVSPEWLTTGRSDGESGQTVAESGVANQPVYANPVEILNDAIARGAPVEAHMILATAFEIELLETYRFANEDEINIFSTVVSEIRDRIQRLRDERQRRDTGNVRTDGNH